MKDLIVTINTNTRKVKLSKHFLGINGENLQGKIIVDFSDQFIDGDAIFEIERSDGKFSFTMTKISEHYEVDIISSLLTKSEKVKCQIRIDGSNDEIFKSEEFEMNVFKAINADETPQQPLPPWAEAELIAINSGVGV